MLLVLFAVAQFVPEHLLVPAETELSLRTRVGASAVTVPPSGAGERESYREVEVDLDARLGILRFLTVGIAVPAVQNFNLRQGTLQTTRVGDPMIGLYAGNGFAIRQNARLELFPFAELSFPSTQPQTLYLTDTPSAVLDHGIVVDTGGISVLVGAVAAYRAHSVQWSFESSFRFDYRLRSNASGGVGFDGRARFALHHFWLFGAQVAGLFAIGGDNPGFISPSRVGDAASWVDLGLLVGVRPVPFMDIQLVGQGPLYAHATGDMLQGTLQFLFHWVSPL